MRVLGTGRANGGISFLHALGCGNGCSAPIDLHMTVSLIDGKTENLDDKHGILEASLDWWRAKDLSLPEGDLGWQVHSDIPSGMGLKSSSALAVAALNALSNATDRTLTRVSIAHAVVNIQTQTGCSLTGGLDDAITASGLGMRLVDNNDLGYAAMLKIFNPLDLEIFIVLRGRRKSAIDKAAFEALQPRFEEACLKLLDGDLMAAFTQNGIAVAQCLSDDEALRLYSEIESGSTDRVAITGSGPAIAVLSETNSAAATAERLDSLGLNFIRTRMLQVREDDFVVDPWEDEVWA